MAGADKKATVTQITALYNCREQKSISECPIHQTFRWKDYKRSRPCRVPLLLAKNRYLRLQWARAHKDWTAEDWKNVARSDEARFLLRQMVGSEFGFNSKNS